MKLHIGCGNKYISGWKHYDAIDAPHIDYVGDARDLKLIANESVEEIYACHILEHFSRKEVREVLKEWYRVLIGGGILRLSVPSFLAIVEEYRANMDIESIKGLVCGGQKSDFDYHFNIFDKKYLTTILIDSGYTEIKEWDWRTTSHSGIDDYSQAYLPHMDKENGRQMSLNIMAKKL